MAKRTVIKTIRATDLEAGDVILGVDGSSRLTVTRQASFIEDTVRFETKEFGMLRLTNTREIRVERQEEVILRVGTVVKAAGRNIIGLKTEKGWTTFNTETGQYMGEYIIRQDEDWWIDRQVIEVPKDY